MCSHRRGHCYISAWPSLVQPSLARTYRRAAASSALQAQSSPTPANPPAQRRTRAPQTPLLKVTGTDLPPIDQWRSYFPTTSRTLHPVALRNPQSADLVADAFVPHGSRDKVILEAFPGQLTRSLLRLPRERIRKLIVIEEDVNALRYLRPLAEADSRLVVLGMNGFNWETYQFIDSSGLLSDVPKRTWQEGVHPVLQFISHMPLSIVGEQLLAQLVRSIPDRQWIFKHGRVPMNFLLTTHLWQRISADISDMTTRCKLSVISQAVAECKPCLPIESLQPYGDHFHPEPFLDTLNITANTRRLGMPYQAVSIIPHENQVIQQNTLDSWDFCLRRLFVQKATPLKSCLPSLAPGAATLLKVITNPELPLEQRIDIKKMPRSLAPSEWAIIVKAFIEWPFKPKDLSINTFMM